MANEIELKLRIDTADVTRLQGHPALLRHLRGEPLTRTLTSIYYDTPDLRLLDAAISLRVRHMAGGWFQAVKGAGHSLAGLHQRMEWEDIIAGSEPDFGKITEPGLAVIFADRALCRALRPIFVTEVERTEWQLAFEDGSEIEAALDLGELRPGSGSAAWPHESICELELELKHGKAGHIFDLALALQADIPLQIENVSKAQRGYVHFRASTPPAPSSPMTERLPADMTADAAFRYLAGRCLQHLQDVQALLQIRAGREDLAAGRMALERLRFLHKLFGRQCNELRQALKRAITLLDAAHEWYILARDATPAPLQQQAQARFAHALHRLKQWLDSQHYQRLLLLLGASLAADVPQHEQAADLIGDALRRGDRKLRAQAKHLPDLGSDRLRKLLRRIATLRYGAALLGLRSPAIGDYLTGLTQLEDALTALHDLELAASLSQHLSSMAEDNTGSADVAPCYPEQVQHARGRVVMAWQALPAMPHPAPRGA